MEDYTIIDASYTEHEYTIVVVGYITLAPDYTAIVVEVFLLVIYLPPS